MLLCTVLIQINISEDDSPKTLVASLKYRMNWQRNDDSTNSRHAFPLHCQQLKIPKNAKIQSFEQMQVRRTLNVFGKQNSSRVQIPDWNRKSKSLKKRFHNSHQTFLQRRIKVSAATIIFRAPIPHNLSPTPDFFHALNLPVKWHRAQFSPQSTHVKHVQKFAN